MNIHLVYCPFKEIRILLAQQVYCSFIYPPVKKSYNIRNLETHTYLSNKIYEY
jgi:hypothetical protein